MSLVSRIIDVQESEFQARSRRKSSEFGEVVAQAMANPGKVIEVEYPTGLNRGEVLSKLACAARSFPCKLKIRAANILWDRGVVQIMRGAPTDDPAMARMPAASTNQQSPPAGPGDPSVTTETSTSIKKAGE